MLSKCANPDCENIFRYMHEGKLFRLEVDAPTRAGSNSVTNGEITKSGRHLEFFWLCDNCAARMTLVYRKGFGITTSLFAVKKLGSTAA